MEENQEYDIIKDIQRYYCGYKRGSEGFSPQFTPLVDFHWLNFQFYHVLYSTAAVSKELW